VAEYCAPGYKVHDGPNEVSPKGHKKSTQILIDEGSSTKIRKYPDGRKQEHPAVKY